MVKSSSDYESRYWEKLLLIGILVLVFSVFAGGQKVDTVSHSNITNSYSVRWVSQFPASRIKTDQKEKRNGRNRNWFSDLIFGEKLAFLVKPMSVLAINPNNYWVADQGTGSIVQVVDQVGEITQFSSKSISNIPSIVGSCFIPDHKILFTDSKLNKIFQYDPASEELLILNETMLLEQPTGIAYSTVNKQIWVAETHAHRLTILNDKGKLIKQIGGRGIAPGMFNFPTYLWCDRSGMVYVVDAMNFRVQIFNKEGEYISSFGEIGDASGYFSRPKGIATDSYGNIYIADAIFHVVQVFDRTGKLLYVFGSQGKEKGEFWMPTGVYIDDNNYIYIADSYNSRVQIFQLTSGD